MFDNMTKEENKNIFEGAKFGDKFVTRDGRVAIFYKTIDSIIYHLLLPSSDIFVFDNGLNIKGIPSNGDIVSRYQEPINEDKLDELVNEYFGQYIKTATHTVGGYKDGFKAGYRRHFMESTK